MSNLIDHSIINKLKIPESYRDGIIKTADKILEKYPAVLKIILFGSCAKENVKDKESDIDICVIMNFAESQRAELENYLNNYMYEEIIDFSDKLVDIIDRDTLLCSEEQFNSALLNPITVTRSIRDEGVVLYEKSNVF